MLATILRVLVRVARLSHNWLVQRVLRGLHRGDRNVPPIVTCYLSDFGLVLPMPTPRRRSGRPDRRQAPYLTNT